MSLPKVYLQIPHYNNADYLEACFESCHKLTYPNLDIHFFNDNSTDNTNELVETIDKSKIQIHQNNERLGRVDNYQNCFKKSKNSDWYVNLDSDDFYTQSNWIDEAMNIVSENPDDKIVHIQSNFLIYVSTSNIKKIKTYSDDYFLISGTDYLQLCIQYYSFSHLGSIYSTELVSKFGAYVDDCLHTDLLTAMRVAIQGNVLIGKKEIGVWRKHDGNQSSNRYSSEEYTKNQVAYYRFFEFCEDYISYKSIKKIIKIFEAREFEKKIDLQHEHLNFKTLFKLICDENQLNFHSASILIKSLLPSNVKSSNDFLLFKNISSGVLTKILSVFISLLSLPLIVDFLGIESYGWIGFYASLVSALYIFDFGFTNIISKEISQNSIKENFSKKTIIGSLELVYYLIGFCIAISIWLSASLISTLWLPPSNFNLVESQKIIRLISLAIFVQWPHSFYSGALFGMNKQLKANHSQLIFSILKIVGILFIFYFYKADIYIFFYWQILISFLILIVQKYFIYQELNEWNLLSFFSSNYLKHIRKLSLGITLIGVFGFIYADLNNIFLAKWLSLKDYGQYNILFNIVLAMIMYCATIKNAIFPHIAILVQSNDINEIKTKFIDYSKLVSYTLIPISIIVSIFSFDVLNLWLHNIELTKNIETSLPWITIGSLLNSLMIIPFTFLLANIKTKFLVIQSGILALISIPFLYFLIQKFGFKGASMYWFFINLIPFLFLSLYINKMIQIDIKSKWKKIYSMPLIYSFFLIVVVFLIKFIINKNPI